MGLVIWMFAVAAADPPAGEPHPEEEALGEGEEPPAVEDWVVQISDVWERLVTGGSNATLQLMSTFEAVVGEENELVRLHEERGADLDEGCLVVPGGFSAPAFPDALFYGSAPPLAWPPVEGDVTLALTRVCERSECAEVAHTWTWADDPGALPAEAISLASGTWTLTLAGAGETRCTWFNTVSLEPVSACEEDGALEQALCQALELIAERRAWEVEALAVSATTPELVRLLLVRAQAQLVGSAPQQAP